MLILKCDGETTLEIYKIWSQIVNLLLHFIYWNALKDEYVIKRFQQPTVLRIHFWFNWTTTGKKKKKKKKRIKSPHNIICVCCVVPLDSFIFLMEMKKEKKINRKKLRRNENSLAGITGASCLMCIVVVTHNWINFLIYRSFFVHFCVVFWLLFCFDTKKRN